VAGGTINMKGKQDDDKAYEILYIQYIQSLARVSYFPQIPMGCQLQPSALIESLLGG
jgi:hypothetical protein